MDALIWMAFQLGIYFACIAAFMFIANLIVRPKETIKKLKEEFLNKK